MKIDSVKVLIFPGSDAQLVRRLLAAATWVEFQTLWADSFAGGLDLLASGQVEVVLLDARAEDARQAIQQVREVAPDMALVAVCDAAAADRVLQWGADQWISGDELPTAALPRGLCQSAELSRVRASLAAARVEAAEARQSQGADWANISHELRTPMNTIIGMAELLIETQLDQQQQSCLQMVLESAESLMSTIDDVLDYARMQSGGVELHSVRFDLRQCLDDVLSKLRPAADEKQLELILQVEPGSPRRLFGDVHRLRQVLLILIGNGIKFTDEGRVWVAVGGRTAGEEVQLEIRVGDTGPGVPEDLRSRIFEAFQRADSTMARSYGGAGLGLAIAAKLASLMGGDLQLESGHPIGSCFRFTAAMAVDPHADSYELPVSSAPAASESAAPRATPLRILLAEDSRLNQRLMQELLAARGHQVSLAGDGREVLELHENGKFDVVLMDLQMPHVDGLEAAREIREREPTGVRVPIVALTAHVLSEIRDPCREAGVDICVAKPIRAVELFAVLDRLLPADELEGAGRKSGDASAARPLVAEPYEIVGRVDWQAALAHAGGSRPQLCRVLAAFQSDVVTWLASIRRASQQGSGNELREAAAQLRAAAHDAGLDGVARCAAALQSLDAGLDQAPDNIANLEAELICVQPALSNYVKTSQAQ